MALHFSTERPEDQFYTDFGNFNKFGEEVCNHFVQLKCKKNVFKALISIKCAPHCPLSGILQARIADLQLFGRSTAGNRLCCKSIFQWYGSFVLLFCLQSAQFLSQLEEFSSQYSLGLSALKNLVKTVLIISIDTIRQLQWLLCRMFFVTLWVN